MSWSEKSNPATSPAHINICTHNSIHHTKQTSMTDTVNPLFQAMRTGDLVSLRAQLVVKPELANAPMHPRAPKHKPMDSALREAWLAVAQVLHEFGAVPGMSTMLEAAAWSADVSMLQWTFDTLDSVVTEAVGVNLLSGNNKDIDLRMEALRYLLSKGLVPNATMIILALQRYKPVTKLLVASGFISLSGLATTFASPGMNLLKFLEHQRLQHPMTYALLPDASNALYVAIHDQDEAALLAAIPEDRPALNLATISKRVGTPLHYAASRGNASAMRVLLAAGASAAFVTESGESLVGAAAASTSLEALEVALQAAPVSAAEAVNQDTHRRPTTPLMAAVRALAPLVVIHRLLLAGVQVNRTFPGNVSVAFLVLYELQDVHRLAALGFTLESAKDYARSLIQALVNNPHGDRLDVDVYSPVARHTVRSMATSAGIEL